MVKITLTQKNKMYKKQPRMKISHSTCSKQCKNIVKHREFKSSTKATKSKLGDMKLFVYSALLLLSRGTLAQDAEVTKSVEDTSQQPSRINWLPVWDDDQVQDDPRQFERNPIFNPLLPFFPVRPQCKLFVQVL